MKNQYFGDINDYFKYRLLRKIEAECGLKIGLCWMLTPDDPMKKEGMQIGYLSQEKKFDVVLFDFLKLHVIEMGERNIKVLEDDKNILRGVKFYSKRLPCYGDEREQYFSDMLRYFSDRDIVFFDPDTGIEVKSAPYGVSPSSKHIYYSEIRKTLDMKSSVILFQHFHMGTKGETREKFIERISSELRKRYKGIAIKSIRTPHVVFFFLIKPKHKKCLNELVSKWEYNQ